MNRRVCAVLAAVVMVSVLLGCSGSNAPSEEPQVNTRGLTVGTLKDGAGQLMPNTVINFYLASSGASAGSATTDSAGRYSKFLTGPLQYRAKVGTVTCTPNPMNVLAGTATINLVKP